MTIRHLEQMMAPRAIAIIGATERDGALGRILLERLVAGGFSGPIRPVNPKHKAVLGLPGYAKPEDLPEAPDLAVIVTPARTVASVIDGLGRRGGRAALVISAGLSRGSKAHNAMLAAAARHGIRLLGPNCIGLQRPGLGLDASFAHRMAPKGKLAFLSQSGAIVGSVIDWAHGHGVGFSHVVSMGDQADVDIGDMLDLLATDTESRAILLYVEGIEDAQGFMSAARAAARVKPVIALKPGRHAEGARAATSHTGALAGTDALFDAAFERAGCLRIRYLEELFDAAEVLDHLRPLTSGAHDRIAIVTNGGGAGVLAADALADTPGHGGGRLATLAPETIAALDRALPAHWSHTNPVDIIGDAGPDRYASAMRAVLDDPGVDAVLAMNCPTALASGDSAAMAVVEAAREHGKGRFRPKPVLGCWLGEASAMPARQILDGAGIACFATPAEAVTGFGYLVRRAKLLERLARVPPSRPEGAAPRPDWAAARHAIDGAVARGGRLLNEAEAKAVLRAAGIPTVRTETAAGVEGAMAAAETLAAEGVTRFALKILSDDIAHKSDVGGVTLDLIGPGAVGGAARTMLDRMAEVAPAARITGFTVQEMVRKPDAHELICGISDDPVFGPAILFGRGGTAVEVVNDKALALPPLDEPLARDLIQKTRIARLMAGYRDVPPANLDAVCDVLIRLSEIARALPMICELDINPLLADAHGVIALDARIVVARRRMDAPVPNDRMAIRPYPVELEGVLTLRDGRGFACRPVKPADAPAFERFYEQIEPHDLRLRFFSTMRKVPARLVATLTQIDYARAMAFVALDPVDGQIAGTGRLVADADGQRGEYSVQIRSDLKGQGLGRMMMERLIRHGLETGLNEIWGDVLNENAGMLALCRKLGFRLQSEEEGIVRVRLDLSAGVTAGTGWRASQPA
ncbi:MAG: bifunctional acetate--CoA ligase family protein/GNAT family N-acetyltransferase [Pseudomonadota bacterium]